MRFSKTLFQRKTLLFLKTR